METRIGFRFNPSDDQLINHYLRLKMLGRDDEVSNIPQINVLDYEPEDLPRMANAESSNLNDQVWFFFSKRNYYGKSQREKRTTNGGFWKVTSKDQKIRDICIKKKLVYRQGRHPGTKTSWIMHEYHPTFNFTTERDFILCKLKKKPDDNEEEEEDNIATMDNNPEEDSQLEAHKASFQGFKEMDYNLNYAMNWHN